MVKLCCALGGVKGNAFPVTIDSTGTVPRDDTWLEPSTYDARKLQEEEKTALVETVTHEDNELNGEFGLEEVLEGMPELKIRQIYVLVVVPEGATSGMSAAPIPLTAEQTKMVMNEDLEKRDEKASAYSFSDLDTAMEERIVKKMRLTKNIPDVKEPVDTSIAGYSMHSASTSSPVEPSD